MCPCSNPYQHMFAYIVLSLILVPGVSSGGQAASSTSTCADHAHGNAAILQGLAAEPDWHLMKRPDWLLDASPFQAGVYRGSCDHEIVMANGLIRRRFRLAPNGATVGLDNLITGESLLRGVKPEAWVEIDGVSYEVGGLKGQANYAFLRPEWIDELASDPNAFRLVGLATGLPQERVAWKRVRHHAPQAQWPPPGVYLRMDYALPKAAADKGPMRVSVHYELYDGIPAFSKWITVHNDSDSSVLLNRFFSEILAAVEYGSAVETRKYGIQPPNIHVETDYAFASFNSRDANHRAVHWNPDPDYSSQVNYLRLTPCLLQVGPEIGPHQTIAPGAQFSSLRSFVMPFDSYDRERKGLAQRHLYRVLAPWCTENPLMMHARFADWERVKVAIDQCAEVGFEMVILTFGSGFTIENDSAEYLDKMKQYADYARSKGIEIGGYSLLASRRVGGGHDVVMPEGQRPTFGNSPCLHSQWGHTYFDKLYRFYEKTGFTLLEHDGSYPGDVCLSTDHPGHQGHEDSRWNQWQKISDFYKCCRSQGIYLNVPDYYYMSGSNKCGMGYREVNWSLPRAQQVIHTRQNIYDGAWQKTPSMGWMFVPLTQYHGGGAAATIEPLHEHLEHYERMIASNLGGGVQACYRGPRLYDTDETKQMVKKWVDWFKRHRAVLEGDIIHLRRADSRAIDYWLNVNPAGQEKGLLMVFNPLPHDVTQTLRVPLYYTGLQGMASVSHEDGLSKEHALARDYSIQLDVYVKAQGVSWYVIK
jgi:hypothetical protein